MSEPATWRTGEFLTLRHLTEHAAICDRADDLTKRFERATAVCARQRQEITRLHAIIRALQEVHQ